MSNGLEMPRTQTAVDRVAKCALEIGAAKLALSKLERELKELGDKSLFNGCWITTDRKWCVIVVEGMVDVHAIEDAADDTRD